MIAVREKDDKRLRPGSIHSEPPVQPVWP
jgi:hypothetical protein